jgi:hypothetical protein
MKRVVPSSSVVELPLLTKGNYQERFMVMQVSLEALEPWDVVEEASKDRARHWRVLAAILCGVPPEMKAALVVKKTDKEAWDSVKKTCEGWIFFYECWLLLGRQFLPQQLAVSIKIHGNIDTMSLDELVNQLQVAEDADAQDEPVAKSGSGEQLMLTKGQWEACSREHGGNDHGGDYNDQGGSNTSSWRGRSRYLSVRKVVPTLTSTSAEIYLSMAGAKQHNDTGFILVPAVGRTSSRGTLEAMYCVAPWCLQRGATSMSGEEEKPPGS